MSERAWLRRLADRAGIEASHHTIDGRRFEVGDDTRERLLAAMGVDATSEDRARQACDAWSESAPYGRGTSADAADSRSAPVRCHVPPTHGVYGIVAQLYSARTAVDWGAGDFRTLRALVDWAAAVGADFVGVNPLHALGLGGADPSPYAPASRLFLHALYLDMEAVPELDAAPAARARMASPDFQTDLARLRESPRMAYAQVLQQKLGVARELHAAFARVLAGPETPRTGAYRTFVEAGGHELARFAVFCAIAEVVGHDDFRRWPAELGTPNAPAVEVFRRAHANTVQFHLYLQFELDRQLQEVGARCRERGLGIGLYRDLAVGAAPGGADVWAHPGLFARGVGLGAPPDPFAWEGQNWGLVPIAPAESVRDGHAFFRALCARNMAYGGALRIDHAMGLRRQYWVPEGLPATAGAYVRCPEEAWFDVVVEESTRHRCVIVGEDLGTVPEGFRETLAARAILRSQVLYFERDEHGEFHAPDSYAPLALVTANTHDLSTLRGLWEGRDIELRLARGLLAEADRPHAEAERQHTREALVRFLRRAGTLTPDTWPDHASLCRAVHLALAGTPCALLGVALDDLGAETEAVNLPGVHDPCHPHWTRRMGRDLAEMARDPALSGWLREVAARRRAPT